MIISPQGVSLVCNRMTPNSRFPTHKVAEITANLPCFPQTKSDRHPGGESPDNRRSGTGQLPARTISRSQHTKSQGCIFALLGALPP